MRLPRKKSGFILIEHLIALVIISISLVAFMGLATAFLNIKDRLNVPDDIKWHVAVQQMNFNYAGFKLTSFNGYDPYTAHFENTVSEKTEVITLVSSWKDGGKIFKGAGGSGGHQPFLYGIRSISMKRNGSRLLISTTLNQGNTFHLNFSPKNRVIYVKVKEDKDKDKEKKNDKP